MDLQKEVLVLLDHVPVTLTQTIDKLNNFNYDTQPVGSIMKGTAPKIGIFPLSNLADIDHVKEKILFARKKYPELRIMLIFSGKLKIKPPELYKLEIKDIFQIPLEEDLFFNKIFSELPSHVVDSEINFSLLMRVSVFDISHLTVIPFNLYLYLPSNKKIVKYLEKGSKLDEKLIDKFKKNREYNLYINRIELSAFNKFSSDTLKDVQSNSKLNTQAKTEELQNKLSEFMLPFFTDSDMTTDESKAFVENLGEILEGLDENKIDSDIKRQLENIANQKMTNFTHSKNVSTYCMLFATMFGINQFEEYRLGGYLHDIGLADMPLELIGKEFKDLSPDDQARYKLHPGNGKLEIENKKLKISSTVINMILYHHEKPDGSGYPYGKKSNEIPIEAKICALADEFDKLTSVREGYHTYAPFEALLKISGKNGQQPSDVYDSTIHDKIINNLILKKVPNVIFNKSNVGKVIVESKTGASGVPTQKDVGPKAELTTIYSEDKLNSLSGELPISNPELQKEAQLMLNEMKAYFAKLTTELTNK